MKLPCKPVLIVAALTITLTAGCSRAPQSGEDPWGTVEVRRQQTIRIGIVSPTSDEAIGALGTDVIRGVELAIEDYGRVHGFGIEVVPIQSQCSEAGGRSAAASLVSDQSIVAVIGPICSTACQGAVPLLDEEHLTVISPSCGASSLTDQSLHNDAFLRTVYEDRIEGKAAAQFAYIKLGARRAALVGDGTIETASYLDAFENTFVEYGGTVISTQAIVIGDDNLTAILNAAAREAPDIIYAPLLPHYATTLTVEKAGTAIADVPIIGGRLYRNSEYIQGAGNAADGVYAAGPYFEGKTFDALAAQYEERYQEPPATQDYFFAYDAAQVILDAINRVSISGSGGSLLIGKQTLRDAIYHTTTLDGLTGSLTCSSFGDCSAATVGVYQLNSEEWNLIYVP